MKKILLALSAAILLALGACQKAPELAVTGPTSIDMSADGSSGSITFTANRDWTVSCSESWVHVSPTSGAGSDGPVTVSVKCDANTTYNDRTATVTIRAEDLTQSVTVKQPQNLGVIVPTQTFDIKADTKSIEVEVQANMEYTVSVSADWIKQSGTKALTSKKLTFSIEENTTYDAREGRITIKPQSGAEQVISVRQQAKDGLELGSTIYEVGVSGGTLEIALKTNVELEVTSGADWIHYTETKALDNRTVILSIDPNDSDAERSGEVKISQKGGTLSSTVTVKQEKPVLTVEKTEYTVGPDGGTLEIAVRTNVEFEVKSGADWIHYTETKALDNRTVILSIDPKNSDAERSGEVKINQKGGSLSLTVRVKQEKPVLTVEKTEYTVNQDGGTLEIAVQTNVEFKVKSGADWIHYTETKALADKTVVLTVDKNDGDARSGEVTISQKGGPITVTVKVSQNIEVSEGEVIDLGLSVKWRSCNVGATSPEECGDHYAWGETEPKDEYSWSTYKWSEGSSSRLIKYNYNSKYGSVVDLKTVLKPEDDVASMKLGGKWRMPTEAEWTELFNNCTWKTVTLNGVRGRIFMSKSNGNSIFLPFAYKRSVNEAWYDSNPPGYYWSSSLDMDNLSTPERAVSIWLNGSRNQVSSSPRFNGLLVRPVTE